MSYVRGEETHSTGTTLTDAELGRAYDAVRAAFRGDRWGSVRYESHGYATGHDAGPTPDLGPRIETKRYENRDGTTTIAFRSVGSKGWYRGG